MKMRHNNTLLIIPWLIAFFSALCCLAPLTSNASPVSIYAFGLSSAPFTLGNVSLQQVKVCYLDTFSQQLSDLNDELAKQRFDEATLNTEAIAAKYQTQFKQLSQALLCMNEAKSLGVTQLPAVVFNQAAVIYGERDIARALAAYQAQQQAAQTVRHEVRL